jgi:hypothetical protein
MSSTSFIPNTLHEKVTVVCARYKRNVDFLSKLKEVTPVDIIIYDKENPKNPHNVPFNKGNEASSYLKYIIDYYDQLPEYTFFIQDEEFAWHHSGSIVDKFREAIDSIGFTDFVSVQEGSKSEISGASNENNQKYYNINDLAHWNKPNLIPPHLYKILLQWYSDFVEEYIPLSKVPNNKDLIYDHRGAAQFLVHRDLIRGLPKVFYERLYNWIITTDLENYVSGRLLEWTWHVFWVIFPRF